MQKIAFILQPSKFVLFGRGSLVHWHCIDLKCFGVSKETVYGNVVSLWSRLFQH